MIHCAKNYENWPAVDKDIAKITRLTLLAHRIYYFHMCSVGTHDRRHCVDFVINSLVVRLALCDVVAINLLVLKLSSAASQTCE